MNESEIFRYNLLRIMAEKGMSPAELSKKADLNPRAVKDIEENRVKSPKLSTVFALAKALNTDPAEMMGLGQRVRLAPALSGYLGQFDEAAQERILRSLQDLRV